MPKILMFHANPDDNFKLRLDKEMRAIQGSISATALNSFDIFQVGAVKIADFSKYFLGQESEIFHFSGHGANKGLIVENDQGQGIVLSTAFLETLFRVGQNRIKCVILSSCYSGPTAEVIRKFVPYVIGIPKAIEDDHAIVFSSSFYGALSYGTSIDSAFDLAFAEVAAYSKASKGHLPVIHKNKNLVEGDLFVYKQAVLSAQFVLGKKKTPKVSEEGLYELIVTLENPPHNVDWVVFNFNHESIKDDYRYVEAHNDRTRFSTEIDLYGNVQIRIMMWFKDRGTGMITTLHEALVNTYGKSYVNKSIAAAINDIEEN